jgi:hypothetical protein
MLQHDRLDATLMQDEVAVEQLAPASSKKAFVSDFVLVHKVWMSTFN